MSQTNTTHAVVTKAANEIVAYSKLKAELEKDELDVQMIQDICEGETDLHETLIAIAAIIKENEAYAEGIKTYIGDLELRRSRLTNTNETLRNIILQAMETANLPTVQGSSTTLTKKAVPAKLIVEDESLVPARFFVPQDPKLDKKALAQAIKEQTAAIEAAKGDDEVLATIERIEGAVMSNGGIALQIRVK